MAEPLTTQLIAELLPNLLTAFPSKHSSQNPAHTADVYRNGLAGLSGESVRAAVQLSIKLDSYFPKVSRLRELATEWERRNRAAPTVRIEPSWDVCGVCGAKAVLRGGMAQARGERGDLLWTGDLDEHGKPIPVMVPTPERWHMDHDAEAHHVRKSDTEGVA